MSVQAKLEVVRRKHIVHLTGFGAYSVPIDSYLRWEFFIFDLVHVNNIYIWQALPQLSFFVA